MTFLPLVLLLATGPAWELSDDHMPLLWSQTEIACCRPMIMALEVAVAEDCGRLWEERRS